MARPCVVGAFPPPPRPTLRLPVVLVGAAIFDSAAPTREQEGWLPEALWMHRQLFDDGSGGSTWQRDGYSSGATGRGGECGSGVLSRIPSRNVDEVLDNSLLLTPPLARVLPPLAKGCGLMPTSSIPCRLATEHVREQIALRRSSTLILYSNMARFKQVVQPGY